MKVVFESPQKVLDSRSLSMICYWENFESLDLNIFFAFIHVNNVSSWYSIECYL